MKAMQAICRQRGPMPMKNNFRMRFGDAMLMSVGGLCRNVLAASFVTR